MDIWEQHAYGLINYLLPHLIGPRGQRVAASFWVRGHDGTWRHRNLGGGYSNSAATDVAIIKPINRNCDYQFMVHPDTFNLTVDFSPLYWQFKKYSTLEHPMAYAARTELLRFRIMDDDISDDEPRLTESEDDDDVFEFEMSADDDARVYDAAGLAWEMGADGIDRIVVE
jgi:hypothetical protein